MGVPHPVPAAADEGLSLTGALWEPVAVPDETVTSLARLGLSPVAARCVAIRWPDQPDAGVLAAPSLDDLHDPFAMHGMDAAVDRLRRAIRDRQRLRIITDYDVDGTTSSLILQAALRIVAPDLAIDYDIPNRLTEGYGFSVAAAERAADDGVDLVVTADIGVRDHAAIAAARARGVDVLVADHHLPAGASVPDDAVVLCPPQAACRYPNPHLAACGVSLKVAQALLADHPKRDAVVRSLLKLAAIGTVADMVPLTTRENRAIVTLGIQELNGQRHHAGLRALLDVCSLQEQVQPSDLGFRIGPRINAAGRVADAKLVVELLNCRDVARARELAQEVERLNRERRDIQERLVEKALAEVAEVPRPFVVVAGRAEDGWHKGVVGIVAARVKELTHRSAAVVSIHGDLAVGSVRTARGVHAVRALESAEDLLVRFGGHPAAAGFTVPTDKIDALRDRLSAWVEEHAADALVPRRRVDAVVDSGDLTDSLFQELARLGPFGQGNPAPRLVVRSVLPRQVEVLGRSQRMVKFRVPRPGRAGLEALWWDKAEFVDTLSREPVDLLGTLSENRWRGTRRLQFKVTDARRSRQR